MDEPTSLQAGWYWHPPSQRPVAVFHGPRGWQAQFVGRLPEDRTLGAELDVLETVTVDALPAVFPQLVPLHRRAVLVEERRRAPMYPLTLPCQICGRLTPTSFTPAPDGTWIARPRCDAHVTT